MFGSATFRQGKRKKLMKQGVIVGASNEYSNPRQELLAITASNMQDVPALYQRTAEIGARNKAASSAIKKGEVHSHFHIFGDSLRFPTLKTWDNERISPKKKYQKRKLARIRLGDNRYSPLNSKGSVRYSVLKNNSKGSTPSVLPQTSWFPSTASEGDERIPLNPKERKWKSLKEKTGDLRSPLKTNQGKAIASPKSQVDTSLPPNCKQCNKRDPKKQHGWWPNVTLYFRHWTESAKDKTRPLPHSAANGDDERDSSNKQDVYDWNLPKYENGDKRVRYLPPRSPSNSSRSCTINRRQTVSKKWKNMRRSNKMTLNDKTGIDVTKSQLPAGNCHLVTPFVRIQRTLYQRT